MKRFVIGKKWKTPDPLKNKAYQGARAKQKAELQKKLGVNKLPGHEPYEVIQDNDRTFTRSIYTDERFGANPDPFFVSLDDKQIMCNCGGLVFEVRYGSCEAIGKCPNCGNEFSIYSG